MKKTYIAPYTKEIKMELSQMVCVSGELNSTETITTRDAIGSRGGFWYDDEEEY